jgi:hypothetical protein
MQQFPWASSISGDLQHKDVGQLSDFFSLNFEPDNFPVKNQGLLLPIFFLSETRLDLKSHSNPHPLALDPRFEEA